MQTIVLFFATLGKAGMHISIAFHNVGHSIHFTGSKVTENNRNITSANVNQNSSEVNEITPLSSLCGSCQVICIFLALFGMA